jgi:hypothetical protein
MIPYAPTDTLVITETGGGEVSLKRYVTNTNLLERVRSEILRAVIMNSIIF